MVGVKGLETPNFRSFWFWFQKSQHFNT